MGKRVIDVKVLPGQPTDGTGKVAIHLFLKDDRGLFVEPNVMDIDPVEKRLTVGPRRGRLACDSRRTVASVTRGNVTTVTPRSDDPRAVTCLRCKASAEYAEMMAILTAING